MKDDVEEHSNTISLNTDLIDEVQEVTIKLNLNIVDEDNDV